MSLPFATFNIPLTALFGLMPLIFCSCTNHEKSPMVSSFAGNGIMGFANGSLPEASFANPMGIAADGTGNLYIADSHNNVIRKISPNGQVSVLAGSGLEGHEDGKGKTASFFYPECLATDKNDNVYVSDTHNNLIRKITPDGTVSTIAGGLGNSAKNSQVGNILRLDNPTGIAVDSRGNIFVADYENDVIRKINTDGSNSVFAGKIGHPGSSDGRGQEASFYLPWGIVIDSANNLYVSDSYNNLIRKISPDGTVLTIAGKKAKGSTNGPGKMASFLHPAGIALDGSGNLFVADVGNQKIRKITPDGWVSTYAGNGQRGCINNRDTLASFNKPYGLTIDKMGNLFVVDFLNNVVRKISK